MTINEMLKRAKADNAFAATIGNALASDLELFKDSDTGYYSTGSDWQTPAGLAIHVLQTLANVPGDPQPEFPKQVNS